MSPQLVWTVTNMQAMPVPRQEQGLREMSPINADGYYQHGAIGFTVGARIGARTNSLVLLPRRGCVDLLLIMRVFTPWNFAPIDLIRLSRHKVC